MNLRDIQIPSDSLWWPLTMVTWFTFIGICLLIVMVVWFAINFRKNRVIYFANRSLDKLLRQYNQDLNASSFARDTSILLKRIYLTISKQSQIVSLSGEKWLYVLDTGFKDKPFTAGIGQVLVSAPYQQTTDFDVVSLYNLCRRRIKSLRVGL